MKKILYFIMMLFILVGCNFEERQAREVELIKKEIPDSVVYGTLIQLNNAVLTEGEIHGSRGFTYGSMHGSIGQNYYFSGLYKDPNDGGIRAFKIPADRVVIVDSDSYTLCVKGLHKYIDNLANKWNSHWDWPYYESIIKAFKYAIDYSLDEPKQGFYTIQNQRFAVEVAIRVPTESINQYIKINF